MSSDIDMISCGGSAGTCDLRRSKEGVLQTLLGWSVFARMSATQTTLHEAAAHSDGHCT